MGLKGVGSELGAAGSHAAFWQWLLQLLADKLFPMETHILFSYCVLVLV